MSKQKLTFILLCFFIPLCNAQPDSILVQIDDLAITEKMLLDDINGLPTERKDFLLSSPPKLNEYIDIYYREKLFEHLALQQKLDKTPEYTAMLKAIKRRLLTNHLIENKKKSIIIPDFTKSAKDFYIVNQPQFEMKAQVEARHILLKSKPDNPDKEAVYQRLTDILLEIKKDPDKFEELAKKHSEDKGSAVKGGYLGKFSKGRMVPEFEQQAYKLEKPNQLTEVFSTQYGYHIIQLIKKHPAYIAPFEQAKNTIIEKLRSEYVEDEYMRWRNSIVDPKKAQINQEKLQVFVDKIMTSK